MANLDHCNGCNYCNYLMTAGVPYRGDLQMHAISYTPPPFLDYFSSSKKRKSRSPFSCWRLISLFIFVSCIQTHRMVVFLYKKNSIFATIVFSSYVETIASNFRRGHVFSQVRVCGNAASMQSTNSFF